jgi:hypothetical protein
LGEVEVFDSQADTFHEAQATAVQQFCHELMIAGHLAEDGLDFVFSKHHWQVLGLFSPDDVRQDIEFLLQDFTVEKKDGAEGLALGGGGDVFVDSKVGEEGGDFRCAHVFGVAFVVEKDEAFDPIVVSVFGAPGVMFEAHGIAELV